MFEEKSRQFECTSYKHGLLWSKVPVFHLTVCVCVCVYLFVVQLLCASWLNLSPQVPRCYNSLSTTIILLLPVAPHPAPSANAEMNLSNFSPCPCIPPWAIRLEFECRYHEEAGIIFNKISAGKLKPYLVVKNGSSKSEGISETCWSSEILLVGFLLV